MKINIIKGVVAVCIVLCFVGSSVAQNITAIEMVFVKGGTFTMGSTPEQEANYNEREKPAHSVTVSDFSIGKYEVTQELWAYVMGTNPSYYRGDNFPVERVNWNDIQVFIKKLNLMTGKKYRLPTEAEWEYAARGGASSKGYRYSGSNNICDVAWWGAYISNTTTNPVGTKQPNELGIYDMSGNVGEWVDDWLGDYTPEAKTNPTGPPQGTKRVFRGGGWIHSDSGCRPAFRHVANHDLKSDLVGFRLVLDP